LKRFSSGRWSGGGEGVGREGARGEEEEEDPMRTAFFWVITQRVTLIFTDFWRQILNPEDGT
jgi:hypothetical protein